MTKSTSRNIGLKELITQYQNNFFNYNYTFFSIALVIGLSTGEIIMSLASICLTINWLLEGNFKQNHQIAKERKFIPYLLIFGYFSLFFWLINTSDFHYALNDLKVKLPLLLFPMIIGTIKIAVDQLRIIIRFFVLGTVFSTLVSLLVYLEVIPIEKSLSDVRNISVFISHIRLSLLVCFSIVLLVYFFNKQEKIFNVYLSVVLICWLFLFLFILQAFTGIFILMVLIFLFLLQSIFSGKNKKVSMVLMLLYVSTFCLSAYKVNQVYTDSFIPKEIDVSLLDKESQLGEIYINRLDDNWLENGNRVWLYIAPNEIKKGWEKRSKIPFDSLDIKGQPIWGTLYRFLTSKNLRKDQEGINQLTNIEIALIESGETNCCEKEKGVEKRVKDVLFQLERYRNGQSPNGHSITQRIVYLKASKDLFLSNFFFGVGLGDVHDDFMDYYSKNNSELIGKNRKRVHNQYMVFAVGLGLVGLVLWLIVLYLPFFKLKENSTLYFYFLIIISLSFLTDNTLERQAGVMFFSIFNSLLLFQNFSEKAKA